ncbi:MULTISPECIES: hypothetical protein [Aphanothece]|uniref:hypothetical protein n=1 Tax=Aphanothece TaxID=1121 RepID=UPI0039851D50
MAPTIGLQDSTGQKESDGPSELGRYRVRPRIEREQTVPQQVLAPRFLNRDDAETFARQVALERHQSVVVEKLAPGGCWLQLSMVASVA